MSQRLRPRRSFLSDINDQRSVRWSRLRLLGLFFLFDALLIVAVLLSFQGTELVQEEVTLLETREVIETLVVERVATQVVEIKEVVPYGSRN